MAGRFNVEQMLWFRMFFARQSDSSYRLNDEAVRNHTPGEQVEYHKREFTNETEDDSNVDELIEATRYDTPSIR